MIDLTTLKKGDKVRVVRCDHAQSSVQPGDILSISGDAPTTKDSWIKASNDRRPQDFNYIWNSRELEPVVQDCRKIPVNVNDTIVYPGRHGSSMWMNTTTVKGFKDGKIVTAQGRVISRADRVAVVGAK